MQKVYYWSPCLANVGTVKSTINSAITLSRFGKKKYQVYLINSCGEWNEYSEICAKKNIHLINLSFNYFKFLPKKGFFLSRISYLIIFFISYLPLLKLLKKNKPDYTILHLITSLPLFLMLVHKIQTKFILRISGFPKLNFVRRNFWKICSRKLYLMTSPTIDLINQIKSMNIFNNDKIVFLQDAIFSIDEIRNSKKKKSIKNQTSSNFFISVGRLTKQKNFKYLIDEFSKFSKINNDYNLLIFGEGEQYSNLKDQINKKNLSDRIFLKGYSKDIFTEMKTAKCFVLSSLWEEPGFVLIEAAMSNLYIISSDCKNGPNEFLLNGEAGSLYKSNTENALYAQLVQFLKIEKEQKKKKIFKAKLNSKKYSLFGHFQTINNLLNNL